MPRTLFVSDLHLSGERPQANALFFDFLGQQAAGADALYILGDLFEAWIGDDELSAPDGDPLSREVAVALKRVSAGGTALYVMHGNRDFLLFDGFAAATGATMLADPGIAEVAGVRTLLLHGDTLCTDDTDYQAWRATARSAEWQREFLSRPLAARREAMQALRERSRQSIREKPAQVMDVNEGAVADAFRLHAVHRMIHGHTHRPARHEHRVDGVACERWVLPDWYGSGGYLVADAAGLRMQRF